MLQITACAQSAIEIAAQFGLSADQFSGIDNIEKPLSFHCPVSCQLCDSTGNILFWQFLLPNKKRSENVFNVNSLQWIQLVHPIPLSRWFFLQYRRCCLIFGFSIKKFLFFSFFKYRVWFIRIVLVKTNSVTKANAQAVTNVIIVTMVNFHSCLYFFILTNKSVFFCVSFFFAIIMIFFLRYWWNLRKLWSRYVSNTRRWTLWQHRWRYFQCFFYLEFFSQNMLLKLIFFSLSKKFRMNIIFIK